MLDKLWQYVVDNKAFFIVIPLILLWTRFDYESFAMSVTPFGVPLDDAYIGYQFARNFAQGRVLEYNVGEQTTGASTLLWPLVMALIYLLTGYLYPNYVIAFLVISKVTATILYFLSITGIYYLSQKYYFKNKFASVMLCSFLALELHMLWGTLSGMEMSLFAFLITFMLIALRENKIKLGAVLGGLIGLTRPEGMVLYPGLILLLFFFKLVKTKKIVFREVKELLLQLIIFVVIMIPWPILNYMISGKPLPATFYMKGGVVSLANLLGGFTFVFDVLNLFGSDYALSLLFVAGVIIYFALKKEFSPEALLAIIFMVLYGTAIPNLTGFGRYYMPVFPIIALVAFYSFKLIEGVLPSKFKKFGSALLMLVPMIIITVVASPMANYQLSNYDVWKQVYGHNVYSINHFEVAMAYWLIDNSQITDVVGTCDIGAPSFIANRYLVDVFGLIGPEVRSWNGTYDSYLRYRNVTYYIDYPANANDKVKANCTIVYNTTYLSMITITAGYQMAIYKCEWL
ncbi:MAG: hypothetical protein WC307_02320 [Candidatus Nanoarchaeia archaeon]|jgi:hypothetical protein